MAKATTGHDGSGAYASSASARGEASSGIVPEAVGLRWTIGDVWARGFEALRLSINGAHSVFGPRAAYAVYFNSVARQRVERCLAPLPAHVREVVRVHDATGLFPRTLAARFAGGLAGGMAWKLAPVRAFPERFELALDNDVILWRLPSALADWLRAAHPSRGLVAGDVAGCYGRFAPLAGSAPVNLGIRGLPPGLDFERALLATLDESGLSVVEPDDEQGLQLAALRRGGEPVVISTEDVTICSPFPPHTPGLGACGAHFVGINAHLPWNYYERPADDVRAEHWDTLVEEVAARVRFARAA